MPLLTAQHKALSGLTMELTIAQGRDLIAKDRSLLGKRTTSDPFVKVYYYHPAHRNGSSSSGASLTFLGETGVVKQTCDPVWMNHPELKNKFSLRLGADDATQLLRVMNNLGGASATAQSPPYALHLRIFDYDSVGEDDAMGLVVVPLNPAADGVSSDLTWYPVQKGFDDFACHNAKGDLQVSLRYTGTQLRDIQRGVKQRLTTYSHLTVGLAWDVDRQHGKIDLDSSLVAVDRSGNVDMMETVYYGNPSNPNRSIVHSGDEQTGEALGDDESITLNLQRIPPKVLALYLVLTVATPPDKTMGDVRSAQVRVFGRDDSKKATGICRFVPSELGATNTAMILLRIAREEEAEEGSMHWTLSPIQEGHDYARDFGSMMPELKALTRDLVPSISIDPTERIAILRKGGGAIRLQDYASQHQLPEWVTFGLSWDITGGRMIDLDASAIMLDANLGLLDIVFFKQLTSKDGSIQHSGDEREGDEAGDDEKINVNLQQVNARVQYIGFVINSYSGQELDDIARASCHLYDKGNNSSGGSAGRDIAKYTLSNAHSLDKHTALVMGCLYRGGGGGDNSDWHLRIISEAAQGRTAQSNVDELQRFLKNNPPPPVLSTPPEDEEIDLSAMVMPDADIVVEAAGGEDEEIVVEPGEAFQAYVPPPAPSGKTTIGSGGYSA